MSVDTTEFSQVAEFGPVEKLEREVQTPMPDSFEKNRQVVYEVGEHQFKVSKVSTRGWTVTHYKGGELEGVHSGYEDTASKVHLIARTKVEEVLSDG